MKPRYATTHLFDRHFQARISPNEDLLEEYKSSVLLFFDDPALVGDHALEGPLKGRRGFWINDEFRVVYQGEGENLLFIDIGTHDQVYHRRKKTSRVAGKELH
jgi:mRNA-degrading endonuclease YafQ of YafQ-DinJ toxin-antitoxin module